MRILVLSVALLLAPAAWGQTPWDAAKKAAGNASVGKLEKSINQKLLEEGRRNQCSFKTDTAVLEPGCDAKMKRLANALVDAKKRLNGAGVKNFTFVVSGHTDTTGQAKRNENLSAERAEVIRKELVARGVPANEIESVGMGSRRPVVKPDDTPAKRARNRRYEIQVKL
ncbi:MAG TPA: OmpA family protein [Anaeromyxobacteraceae bacterium]|nr:OmpA family protein [Anaeromyxobacteraceae bacterium]